MENYKSNSHKSREKKVEKIISGNVKKSPKSSLRKFVDVFVSDDVTNVKNYIISDILIPTIKKTLYDMVTNSLDMTLYGNDEKNRRNSSASRVSYGKYYDEPRSRRSDTDRSSRGYNYDSLSFDRRKDAEDVLARMDELMETYGVVSVGDLYDLVGITGSYTDEKYGWTDIRSAQIVSFRGGYTIKLPRAIPIT